MKFSTLVLFAATAAAAAVPAANVFERDACATAAGCAQRTFNGDPEYYCCTNAQSTVVNAQCSSTCHRTTAGHGFSCSGGSIGWHCHSH